MRIKRSFFFSVRCILYSLIAYGILSLCPAKASQLAGLENLTSNNGNEGLYEAAYVDKQVSKVEDRSTDLAADADEIIRPQGWTKATHSKKAEPNYRVVFENSAVPKLNITIAPSDWQAMMADMEEDYGPFGGARSGCGFINPFSPREDGEDQWDVWAEGNPIYVPCDIEFQGKTWWHVGIRFKGDSSLAETWQFGSYKLPLRFNFDKFEDQYPEIKNQRFYGFDKLALASGFMDYSLSREKLACDIFREAGVPVGRAAFYRVFIDYGEGAKYFGLYTLQEIPARPMLKTLFKNDDGNLYKPEGTGAAFDVWDEVAFDKETNEDEADFSDVRALFDALHSDRSDMAAYQKRLTRVFDVDGFLLYLAVNQVITNWDSYGRTPHNYFIYHDPEDDRIHWIPYDFNLSLGSPGLPLSLELSADEVGEKWPLIRYIMDIPEYHSRYVQYVKQTIDEIFNPARMQRIYVETKRLIEPFVIGAEGEVSGYTMLPGKSYFNQQFRLLNRHVQRRYTISQQFVQQHAKELSVGIR